MQLVCYPIVNLRRLKCGARAYVEGLEDTVIATVAEHGLSAQVQPSDTMQCQQHGPPHGLELWLIGMAHMVVSASSEGRLTGSTCSFVW